MRLYAIILCLMAVACTNNTARNMLQTEHAQASTQIAELRLSATVQAARIQTTLDHSGTQVASGVTLSDFIKATLNSEGVSLAQLEQFEAQFVQSSVQVATPTPAAQALAAAGQTQAPPLRNDDAIPTAPGVTPLAMIVTPTIAPTRVQTDPNAPFLENPVTALGVGPDDCAVDSRSTFTIDTSQIYLVVTAVNTPMDAIFASRWSRDGALLAEIEFSLNFPIDRACIWFFVDQSDFEFVPGTYSADLSLNGVPAGSTVTFTLQ